MYRQSNIWIWVLFRCCISLFTSTAKPSIIIIYLFSSSNPNASVVKPYITYITSITKVLIYFIFVRENIFTRTTAKYRFLRILAVSESFLFAAFDCVGFKILERPESFLQVLKQSLLFIGFDCPRSKIDERELFSRLSQIFLFRRFCIKKSETSEVAESFFGIYIFDLSGWAWAWSCKAMLSGGVWSFLIEFQVLDICTKTLAMFEENFSKFLDWV